MAIDFYTRDRYNDGAVIRTLGGLDIVFRPKLRYSADRDVDVRYEQVRADDTLESIAYRMWRDQSKFASEFYWVLAMRMVLLIRLIYRLMWVSDY